MQFVYILRCSDTSLYVGHTSDLSTRERVHNDGGGADYTARRRPVTLVYSEAYESLGEAVRRERQLKRWSREKKEALINCDIAKLKRLSKRRNC